MFFDLQEDCEKKMQECTNSSVGTNVAVCGSDGISYPNRCEVISRQCQGASVFIKHTGSCPGINNNNKFLKLQCIWFNKNFHMLSPNFVLLSKHLYGI